jgi:hypothetical protein
MILFILSNISFFVFFVPLWFIELFQFSHICDS